MSAFLLGVCGVCHCKGESLTCLPPLLELPPEPPFSKLSCCVACCALPAPVLPVVESVVVVSVVSVTPPRVAESPSAEPLPEVDVEPEFEIDDESSKTDAGGTDPESSADPELLLLPLPHPLLLGTMIESESSQLPGQQPEELPDDSGQDPGQQPEELSLLDELSLDEDELSLEDEELSLELPEDEDPDETLLLPPKEELDWRLSKSSASGSASRSCSQYGTAPAFARGTERTTAAEAMVQGWKAARE